MEKINVAELLKDCPEGMELDCMLCNNPIALEVVKGDEYEYPIKAVSKDGFHHVFTKYGTSYTHDDAKCVIFPKGKTTWEGFVPPCKFKNGDVISNTLFDSVCIFRGEGKIKGTVDFYCGINTNSTVYNELFIKDCKDPLGHFGDIIQYNFATEEEKEKLFKAIKDNGYKWNSETKTLEKLFKPKFKVGDRIRNKKTLDIFRITNIDEDSYYCGLNAFWICDQDNFELVPNKFEINTLIPFESKVLARDNVKEKWYPGIWGFYDSDSQDYKYKLIGVIARYCIPYEGNQHLLGKTDDCDEYFKTWE